MKRTTMTKYLSIDAYLEYQKILNESEEPNVQNLDNFFNAHWLPTTRDMKEQNLRVYIGQDIAVNIYNVDEMKKDRVLITEKLW